MKFKYIILLLVVLLASCARRKTQPTFSKINTDIEWKFPVCTKLSTIDSNVVSKTIVNQKDTINYSSKNKKSKLAKPFTFASKLNITKQILSIAKTEKSKKTQSKATNIILLILGILTLSLMIFYFLTTRMTLINALIIGLSILALGVTLILGSNGGSDFTLILNAISQILNLFRFIRV